MKKERFIFVLTKSLCGLLALFFAGSLSACAQLSDQTTDSKKIAKEPPKEPVGNKKNGILLVYPRDGATIDCQTTFLVGSLLSGSQLFCNGQPVKLSPEGYFAHVLKLSPGKNNVALSSDQETTDPLRITIQRPLPQSTLPAAPLKLLADSLQPKESLGLVPGDLVAFAARATPGAEVSVQLPGKTIKLQPVYNPKPGKKISSVKLGMDTAFGISYQRTDATQKDLYLAFYKINPADNWHNVKPIFVAQKANNKAIRQTATGSLTIVDQPSLLTTMHDKTIIRTGPDAARLTPLDQDIRLFSDGYKGKWKRLLLCPGNHAWILDEDLAGDTDNGSLPEAKITTVNLESDSYGARIVIPLNQRLPYRIEQELKPGRLILHIYGATADTDFVTADTTNQEPESPSSTLIDSISWKQKSDLHYELTANLKGQQQWGFFAAYEGSNLVLHIKSPPKLAHHKSSLEGSIICLDPGHGGQETGSIGCGGSKEATINLAIAQLVRRELEKMGATVVMTRTEDIDVGLADRVETAVKAQSDLLISIHNNALPDGRDPNKELGTSSYWYQPQSIELAKLVKNNLVTATNFPDYGHRYQNLALCRPSQMPAVLIEVGFMINPSEFTKLINPEFQDRVAQSIAQSIKAFLLTKTAEPSPSK